MLSVRFVLVAGALAALLAVALGAFAAHALKSTLSEQRLAVFETAVRYQMFHALSLLAIALLAMQPLLQTNTGLLIAACMLILIGIVLFCGSLYLLVLTDTTWLGVVTPFGGLAFIAGWCVLIIAILRSEV